MMQVVKVLAVVVLMVGSTANNETERISLRTEVVGVVIFKILPLLRNVSALCNSAWMSKSLAGLQIG
jgi:hypothetical protein